METQQIIKEFKRLTAQGYTTREATEFIIQDQKNWREIINIVSAYLWQESRL